MNTAPRKWRHRSESPEDTRIWAQRWAGEFIHAGDVIALYGGLGAGKTCFTQGVARAFDVRETVSSPTYTLVHEYEGTLPVYHMDLYRIAHPDEATDIGVEDYLERGGVSVVEWAEHAESLWPERTFYVQLQYGEEAEERMIEIRQGKQRP
jgi:tRNA threonylcarbamoyladenosine biosynthesis protein TsaE